MAVHRRQLPLSYQCEGFVPVPGSTGDGGFCERCQQRVHDVSAMRESELRKLLAAHAGGRVCLAYRTDARGRVRLRPEPTRWRPLAVGALAMLLAACAGHAAELETPGTVCRDADGYVVSCPEWAEPGMLSVPDADEAIATREREAEGCPVRPTAPGPASDPALGSAADPASPPPTEPWSGDPAVAPDDAAPGAAPTSAKFRANFDIDPDAELVRGIVVVDPDGWIDRDFVPTAELWQRWRERRAERKQARLRLRESRRASDRR
jgi:hypothetical protein